MPNPFSWDYLNTVPPSNNVVDAWSIIMLIVFAGGFLISSIAFYKPGLPPIRGLFGRKSIEFAAGIGLWIFGAGLFFFLIQLLQIDPFTFGRRLWMFLTLIAAIVFIAMIGYRTWNRMQHRKSHEMAVATGAIKRAPPQRRPVKRRRI